MGRIYDIAVLGSNCAGLAAGYQLARKGLDVVIVQTPGRSCECPLSDWIPAELFDSHAALKDLASACQGEPFKHICYHNAELDKQVCDRSRGRVGYFLSNAKLRDALTNSTRKAGASFRATNTLPEIELGDQEVRLSGPINLSARMAILTQGDPGWVAGDLALPLRTIPRTQMVAAGLDIPVGSAESISAISGKLNIVEMKEHSELGMFFAYNSIVHLRVISTSSASGTRAAELSALAVKMQHAGLLCDDLQLERAVGAVWQPPSGLALELETHVVKRCLLAGEAGGFCDSVTGQILAPSIHSALLAADVAISALKQDDVQQALADFQEAWQDELASGLRPPSTPPQLLLPLLFVNDRIAARFSRTLLCGEQF